MTFTLPKLDFSYDDLEPYIDAKTMEIHHSKHHQAYIDKANGFLAETEWGEKSPCEILKNLEEIPKNIRQGVINNVGGHCNHSFFWCILSPNSKENPVGNLANKINETFGDFENFKNEFTKSGLSRFGSGWTWLVLNKNKNLEIISTANQDSPLTLNYKRILGLDVWEHAYYLNYQNRRPEYIKNFWKIVNWEKCEEFFNKGGI